MEQINMVMAMYQAMAAQGMVPKMGKSGDKAADEFQKLLDQKAQPAQDDAPADGSSKPQLADNQKENAPIQEESALEKVKKLAEQGYAIFQPTVSMVTADGQTFEPGEYVIAWKDASVQFIPTADLSGEELDELSGMLTDFWKTIDVSDPEADALLEATDPTVDHSPVELLQKAVDQQAGKVVEQAVEEAKPQEKDEEQVVLVDVDQGAQPLFHDVKAAPVKVGETENVQQTNEPDVVNQVENQIVQAIQRGDSTVTMKLNPENLGEVTVQLSMKSGNVLSIAISARSDDTRALLERHSANLQGLLSSRVRESVEVNVQRNQESQENQNQQHSYDGHNGHAQDNQEQRQHRQQHTSPEDFMQQLRLGLIPDEGI